ncbi:MAG: hypothetical protein LBG98_01435 [Puniceicoccales bacterium]|nr:hypothetical protein [Puniceicoccales bacterium]
MDRYMKKKLLVTLLCGGIGPFGADLFAMKKSAREFAKNTLIPTGSSQLLSRFSVETADEITTGRTRRGSDACQYLLSDQNVYLKTFLEELEPIINANLKQQLSIAFAGFVEALVQKIEVEGIRDLSHQEFLMAHLKHEATFCYLRRADRSEREQMALYTYTDAAVAADDGLFNKVKRNVLDEVYMLIGLYNALVGRISPHDLIDEREFLQYVEFHINTVLDTMLSHVTGAVFSLLSELISEPCCGCLSKTKLSYNERVQLASSTGRLLKGVLKKFLDKDIVEGVSECIDVFLPGKTLPGKNKPSSIPMFKE